MTVTKVETKRNEPYAGGRPFGDRGVYKRIDGVLSFAVDPNNQANQEIVDLKLAPRDDTGRVVFRADYTLLAPEDPDRGNRRLIVDVVNRGRRRAVDIFNRASNPTEGSGDIPEGDGFLFHHGYTVVSIGWQWDVYGSKDLLALDAPQAQIGGSPVRGQAVVEIRPNRVEHSWLLANRRHRPYPVADPNDPDARLLVREWEDGPDAELPRDQWRFARETADGPVDSREHICLESGFQPGKIYNIIYTTDRAPVVGGGLLALREVATWLRHPSAQNPVAGGFERVYGYGVSQTGRMLRHFAYLGLNVDEEGRPVYDGLLPHVAGGRRGEFNHRFAQPSAQPPPGFGQLFPFADEDTLDPFTGRTDGLLRRQRSLGAVPKIIYTNSSAEYWRGDGSLTHIDPTGQKDLETPAEARIYHFAGTQHGAGSLPQQLETADGSQGSLPFNTVDYRPLLRAALINLDRWVSDAVEPPASRHPRLDDGTAVRRDELLESFDAGPDTVKPDPNRLWVLREVDLGPKADEGIGRYPVQEGATYKCLVSAVDSDGNELAGIRLPDLEIPVGTHAGWNPRAREIGAPEQILSMQGFTTLFPATRASRQATGDSRPSIEERYRDRDAYLRQVREAAQRLVDERYLLEEDIEIVVSACADRYDVACAEAVPSRMSVGDGA